MLGTVALGTGLALVPVSANAQEVTTSYAAGQFLSGTLLGGDLADVVALGGVEARNDGTKDAVTSRDPLNATVLDTVGVDAPNGVQLDLGKVLDAGAVNQYAEAKRDGTSLGASGAIGNDGAIGVGAVGRGPAGNLDLDLGQLLGPQFASSIADLKLSLQAVAAQARGDKTTASGDYTLAGATLNFSSPAIANLTPRVNDALGVVDQLLIELGQDDGRLGNAVDGVLDPALGVLGSSADVKVQISTDLRAAVADLLKGSYGDGAVSFDLQTGAVSVNLAKLLGGQLNDLPPGTELLTDAVLNRVLDGITQTVSTLADQIVERVRGALNDAQVTATANLNLLSGGGTTQDRQCTLQQVPVIGDIVGQQPATGNTGGLLGGLGGLLAPVTTTVQGIVGYTTQEVCGLVDSVLPSLESTVAVNVQGTVGQLRDGVAAKADASISLLGGTVPATVNVDAVIGGLGAGLTDGLFGGDSAISRLVDALNTGLVDPAVTGLTGDTGVGTLLRDLVSVKANVQETGRGPGGSSVFTQTAVRVALLPGAGTAATVNVAAASVGPNITQVVDPGDPGNPGGPGTPGNPGGPGAGGAGGIQSAGDRLAYTGIGIAALLAIVLALLAAGAYLAREGYRRRHPGSIAS